MEVLRNISGSSEAQKSSKINFVLISNVHYTYFPVVVPSNVGFLFVMSSMALLVRS